MARHFYSVHKHEPLLEEVIKIMDERKQKTKGNNTMGKRGVKYTEEDKKYTKDLQDAMKVARSKCLLRYNDEIRVHGGALMPSRRPKKKTSVKVYNGCPDCGKPITKKCLNRHCRDHCPFKNLKKVRGEAFGPKKRRNVLAESELLEVVPVKMSKRFRKDIIQNLSNGILLGIIAGDPLIIMRGEMLWKKHRHYEHRGQYVRCKLREMARFLRVVRDSDSGISSMEQLINPHNLDLLVECAHSICGLDDDGYFERPSLGLKIGYELRRYGQLLRRKYLTRPGCTEKYDTLQ
ncbi:uncharacterized protein LOC127750271, partial [Frankliniella occidentalis]|uniref:Uncharacterized protein LOC127750271 n=1 Tax=Frankliniella occidentalis TaxID=133901 RepID=A0A9C6X1F8_FRAOC